MRTIITACALGALALSVTACASDGYGSNGYGSGNRYASSCERHQSNKRAAATVIGAGVGALAGSAIAGNNSNTAGVIAGAAVGGVIGHETTKSPSERCGY